MSEYPVIPIFPLPLVACPTEPVPLHIFEERYKAMVRDLRNEDGGSFGLFFEEGEAIEPVGTLMSIATILKEYDNGRMDLVALGGRRCRIRTIRADHAYRSAEVELLMDVVPDWDERLATEAFSLHRTIIHTVTGSPPPDSMYEGTGALSFLLAQSSNLTPRQKLELITMCSEDERLRFLVGHLSTMQKDMERLQATYQAIHHSWDLQKFFFEWKGKQGS